ncbi:Universal stress protein [Labilithrix luteola]|uniref:Universal stress protein n=1 Tax=Labilithrix luteola TaxID=1391654 RepID=A0A0K1PXJ9_9BACT|nr:universal stress protein [Labilithrix luteola]AKU98243.1 Universal stress protein [Labilithrix luteola]
MAALHTILVPFDGSEPSIAALDHAVALAEDFDATVDVVHVEAPDEFEIGSMTPLSSGAREELEEAMNTAASRVEARIGNRLSRRIVSGDPLRKIVEIANDGDYDLIVMGTHGRVGRLRSMLGSVAEGVVRNAPCPVLTVRQPGGDYQSFAERRHGELSLAEQAQRHHS